MKEQLTQLEISGLLYFLDFSKDDNRAQKARVQELIGKLNRMLEDANV